MPHYLLVEVNEGGADFRQYGSIEDLRKDLWNSWSSNAERLYKDTTIHSKLMARIAQLEIGEFGSYPCGMVFRIWSGSTERALVDLEKHGTQRQDSVSGD